MKEDVLVCSDIHLGYEESNTEAFNSFLDDVVMEQQPDCFVIAGDLFEFWRRGIESVMAEHARTVAKISEIADSGIETVILLGNHDERFKESSADEPWDIDRFFEFKSGGTVFRVEHGNRYDPANANAPFNERLCLTTDKQGDRLSDTYALFALGGPLRRSLLGREPILNRPSLNTLEHLGNPDVLADSDSSRAQRIDSRAAQINEEYTIQGHTHVSRVEDRVANCGSWTGDENTYIRVQSGEVSSRTYPNG